MSPAAPPVLEITENKSEFVRPILESLPEWFGIYDATEAYIANAEHLTVLGCRDGDTPVSVISLRQHFHKSYEIDVMAVVPAWHRHGLGRRMIEAAVTFAESKGAKMLTVKTLGASHPDTNYAATREFYLSVGFIPLEELKTLWSSGNPCLFLARPLS